MPSVRREQGRFREIHLRQGTPGAEAVLSLAREVGFSRAGIADPKLLVPFAHALDGLCSRGLLAHDAFDGMEWDWVLRPALWAGSSSILICCLSCFRDEPDDLSTPDDPHALIAPFARANYYKKAMQMLHAFARRLEDSFGVPRSSLRLFSNSRLPEKPLLVASGLGAYGKNGLAIVPGLGSTFVIAGAVIPSVLARPASALADPCGSCRLCIKACPSGAIGAQGRVDPARCLQGQASRGGAVPHWMMEKWGARLYGCQECQAVCPHNTGLTEKAQPAPGELGQSIPLRSLLALDQAALKERFRGTALGLSWVSGESLPRNALLAAGGRGAATVKDLVTRSLEDDSPVLREAARWALARMGADYLRPPAKNASMMNTGMRT
jgi:epoxyqueuosine reductase